MDEEFEDEEYMFLSQQQSMFLIKTIMGWFEDQNNLNSVDENINSELCQLLNILLISLCEVSGSHWEFIINYCISNLKVNIIFLFFIFYFLFFNFNYLLFIIYYLLFTIYYLLFILFYILYFIFLLCIYI